MGQGVANKHGVLRFEAAQEPDGSWKAWWVCLDGSRGHVTVWCPSELSAHRAIRAALDSFCRSIAEIREGNKP